MADRMEFTAKLAGILELAVEHGNHITLEEVEKYFEEDNLSNEQIGLVCEYLMSQKIAVAGYKQQSGMMIDNSEEQNNTLSQEEQAYIDGYLREIAQMPERTEEEALMKYYLPKIVEIAVELHEPGIYVGDMIQEGSISLMMAMRTGDENVGDVIVWDDEDLDSPDGDIASPVEEEQVLLAVRDGMLAMIEAQTETRRRDNKMVHKVSELDETIKAMSDEYGRKVAIDEVAEKLGITEDEIADILKLAGEEAPTEEELEDMIENIDRLGER